MQYDLIICGAGPAGSVAAESAARSGMRVALLEKQTLPRHKTCGGGMPMVVGNLLQELVPEAFVEADVRWMRHTWRYGEAKLAPINPEGEGSKLSLWMVQRAIFDHALAQRAAHAGADLRDGLTVRMLEEERDGVIVRATSQGNDNAFTAKARYVLGADGANGLTAKAANLRKDRVLAIAMEVEYPHRWNVQHPYLRPDVIHLEYGAVRRGYAWIFPKADHLNIGAGVFRPRSDDGRGGRDVRDEIQSAIRSYLELFDLPYDPSQLHYFAHPLPLWNGREPLQSIGGRILLAGDAAGLINPVFGDGILHAVKSGLIAADCLINGVAHDYTHRIHAEFAANFDAALKLARFFYQWSALCYRHGVIREGATQTAARLLCGDAIFTDVSDRILQRLKKMMGGLSVASGVESK